MDHPDVRDTELIEFKPEHRYVAFWFAQCKTFNFMGAMWLNEADKLMGKYRNRYFKDDKIFDSDDERTWHEVDFNSGPDRIKEAIEVLRQLILADGKAYGIKWEVVEFDELPQTPGDQMFDYLATKKWVHMRREQP